MLDVHYEIRRPASSLTMKPKPIRSSSLISDIRNWRTSHGYSWRGYWISWFVWKRVASVLFTNLRWGTLSSAITRTFPLKSFKDSWKLHEIIWNGWRLKEIFRPSSCVNSSVYSASSPHETTTIKFAIISPKLSLASGKKVEPSVLALVASSSGFYSPFSNIKKSTLLSNPFRKSIQPQGKDLKASAHVDLRLFPVFCLSVRFYVELLQNKFGNEAEVDQITINIPPYLEKMIVFVLNNVSTRPSHLILIRFLLGSCSVG